MFWLLHLLLITTHTVNVHKTKESFYFTKNFWLPKFKNRGCVTANFGFPTVTMALGNRKMVMQPRFLKFGN